MSNHLSLTAVESIMLFNTPEFVFSLLVFIICWYILPKVCKKPVLLIFSYFFAWNLGGLPTVITLLAVTALTWVCGFLIERTGHRKLIFSVFVILVTFLLFYTKYVPLISEYLNEKYARDVVSISVVSMAGVSYYALSAISYLADIVRGKDQFDTSLLDTAIWIVYFPKLIAGPIERHGRFKIQMEQLAEVKFDFERIKRGLLICALGYFYKIMIADRLSLFVDSVYADVNLYEGFLLFLTAAFFMLQLYFDFAGYSLIAYGVSWSLGIKITKNFNLPFFSQNLSEFWSRWHISLSSWLRDYIYIPLGGNRRGWFMKNINLLITFIVSGMWHGEDVTFLIWGLLNGAFQIIEKPFKKALKLPKFLNILITACLYIFTFIFFRSDSMLTAKRFIRRMLRPSVRGLTDGTLLNLGLNLPNWIVLILSLAAAFTVEVLQYKNISIYQKLQGTNIVLRWFMYYLIIIVLVIFGMYGPQFDAANFIYLKF